MSTAATETSTSFFLQMDLNVKVKSRNKLAIREQVLRYRSLKCGSLQEEVALPTMRTDLLKMTFLILFTLPTNATIS